MKPLGTPTRKPAPWRAALLLAVAFALAGSTVLTSCSSSQRRRKAERARPQELQDDMTMRLDDREPSSFDGEIVFGDETDADARAARDRQSPAPRGGDAGPFANPAAAQLGQVAGETGGERSPDEILEDMKARDQVRLLEAQQHARLGEQAMQQGDYQSAADHFRTALDLNPALPGVRERYSQALQVLGVRDASVPVVEQDINEKTRASQQQRLEELRLGISEAKELIDDGEYEKAEKNLGELKELLSIEGWFAEDVSSERQVVDDLLREVRAERIQARIAEREEVEESVRQERLREKEAAERARQRQINELVSKTADYLRFRDYEKAIESSERILRLDPDHRVARWWLRLAKKNQLDYRQAAMLDQDAEALKQHALSFEEARISYTDPFNFPREEEWERVLQRQQGLQVVEVEDSQAVREIKNKLENVQIQYIEFNDEPIGNVVEQLRSYIGINMTLDTAAVGVQDATVTLTLQNIRAIDALNLILKHTGLAKTYRYDVLLITSPDRAAGEGKFRIYNVSDILNKIRDFPGPELRLRASDEEEGVGGGTGGLSFDIESELEETTLDPDRLQDLIKASSGGDEAWGQEGYSMLFERGLLLVTAPVEAHRQILSVLENLRKDSDIFVMIEARFIDITDDFLEDIGVDYRSLGAVSNLGTPFGNIINDNSTGGNDLGFVKQGSPENDATLVNGQDRWAGRMQNIIDGFTGVIDGERLNGGAQGIGGLSLQSTWLDPFQLNAILRAVSEKSDVRQLTAPTITAHNGQRVFVSVITQRAYIADYELVSGGTGFQIIEVADPVVRTFQEGVILDVDPVISPDKKYITLDVRPTMATLIGGVISTILISLGSFTSVAFEVPIGVPEISLQQSFTSVTVPNGGTVLLGGFKSLSEAKFNSRLPFLGQVPILNNLFRRKAEISEKRSLVLLITARIINPREREREQFNEQ